VVDFDVELVVEVLAARQRIEVVGISGARRSRQVGQDLTRERRDRTGGNDAIRVDLAGERVLNRLAENAQPQRRARDAGK
jgi:hypothetical protein